MGDSGSFNHEMFDHSIFFGTPAQQLSEKVTDALVEISDRLSRIEELITKRHGSVIIPSQEEIEKYG